LGIHGDYSGGPQRPVHQPGKWSSSHARPWSKKCGGI